jgi:tRNA (cmo5U34)-methyltransferase
MNNDVTQPQWEELDSQNFIDYGKYFVPDRESQINCICDLIPRPSEPAHILDLCCGAGLLTRALLDRFPECQVHGLDGSPKMLAQIEKALTAYGKRFEAIQFDLAASDWRQLSWPVHAVVSSLAIHHLDDTEKQTLFKDMASILAPGGSFIIADLIQPTTQLGKRVAAKAWDEAVYQRSRDLDGNLSAYNYFREIHWNLYWETEPNAIDKPSSLFDQLKWLDTAGFTDVDVFWMKAGHAIFGGRKPHTHSITQ